MPRLITLLASSLVLLSAPTLARGQLSSYRQSLTGEAAAAGRRGSSDSRYNLLLGPVRLKLDASLEIEYNDNVYTTSDLAPKKSDLFFRPRLNIDARWRATQQNEIHLRLGLGYEASINDTRRGTTPFSITPDSELSFDLYVGDFRITLHDRFSLTNNPSDQSAASSSIGFNEFTNDAGITALWDLNDLVLTLGFDEISTRYSGRTVATGQPIDLTSADRDTHQLQFSSAFLLSDTFTAGLQATAALSSYASGAQEQTIFTAGPFAQFQFTAYTRFLLSAGGVYSRNTGGPSSSGAVNQGGVDSSGQAGNDLGYYWSVAITNRLNAAYTHQLSAGHERVFGIATDYQDLQYIRYEGSWQLIHSVSLSGSLGLEHVQQLGGLLEEKFSRWAFGVAIGYQLTEHLRAALRYTHYSQDSDLETRDYVQNLSTLALSYDF